MQRVLFILLCWLLPVYCDAALVAHWKCQDNAASTTVVATVGSNGTLNGGDNTTTISVAGPGGLYPAALNLNGTDDYITNSFASSDTISVSAWVYLDAVGSYPMFVVRSTAATNGSFGFELRGSAATGKVEFSVDTTNQTIITSVSTTAITGGWHHVMGVYNGSNVKVYVDGVLEDSDAATGTISWGATPAAMLGRREDGGFFADARLADVRIYDSDESANVAIIMADGRNRPMVNLSGNLNADLQGNIQ